jgi:hypothetical protein
MRMIRRSLILVSLLCSFGHVFAHVPVGVIIDRSSTSVTITYNPQITIDTSADASVLNPQIKHASYAQDATGRRAWRVLVDIDIPANTDLRLVTTNIRSHADQRPLLDVNQLPVEVRARTTVSDAAVYVHKVERTRRGTRATIAIHAAYGNAASTTLLRSCSARFDIVPFAAEVKPAAKRSASIQADERYDAMYRVNVDDEGIYRISADELRRAGISTSADAARTIKVFGNGSQPLSEVQTGCEQRTLVEQPIIVRTTSSGEIDHILFYAQGIRGWSTTSSGVEHVLHPYTTSGGYLVALSPSPGLRAQPESVPATPVINRPQTVTSAVVFEEELVSPYNSGSGRRWYGRSFEQTTPYTVTTPLPGLARTGTVYYRAAVGSRSSASGAMTVSENGKQVAQRVLARNGFYMDAYCGRTEGVFAASQIASDDRSLVRFSYTSTDKSASGFLDWLEIHYPRAPLANNGELMFWSDSTLSGTTEYDVNGFSGTPIGFDVTDPHRPVLLENVTGTGGMFTLRLDLERGTPHRFFVASATRSASLQRITYSNLRSSPANVDMIVITHPELKESALQYAAYRTANDGLTITVVTTEEIFNEFSYGMQDPTAIRDYLARAALTWTTPAQYVLLWGDGHFDYKGITTQATNFVIPYESDEPDDNNYGLYTHTTDDYFARIEGENATPDLAIGRMPITSERVGEAMLAKIKRYEHEMSDDLWRTRLTMIADDGPTSDGTDGPRHLNQSERLATMYVPPVMQDKKIYLVEYPTENIPRGRRKPGAADDFISTTNTTGGLLVNWIGHGNPRVWAHEQVFTRETTVPLLNNNSKLFFLTAATCDFARFDIADLQSGAEDLVLSEQGGAIGIFSASRVVLSDENAAINEFFYETAFTRNADGRFPRLGDVMQRVKRQFSNENDQKFFLLGDPSMRLLIPDRTVAFTSINGESVTDTTNVQLQALSTVRITGGVTLLNSTVLDTTFNGVVTLSLFDSDVNMAVTDVDGLVSKFVRLGPGLNRSSYPIVNGRFEAEFVVPKDISFRTKNGNLYGYAASEDERYAMGVTNRVTVNGISDEVFTDDEGPSIAIYMDSRRFLSGDLVRKNPILIVDLKDATGVNTTGIGVGHNLEATFDEGALVEDLTSTFTTSLTDSRAGTAQKQIFGLPAGVHTVRVRSWDVLNNVSEASTIYRTADEDATFAGEVSNSPNPFSSSTTITYKHNQPGPFTAELRLYDLDGRVLRTEDMNVTSMASAEWTWDGRDDAGDHLSTGVYTCVITLRSSTGSSTVTSGKLLLLR